MSRSEKRRTVQVDLRRKQGSHLLRGWTETGKELEILGGIEGESVVVRLPNRGKVTSVLKVLSPSGFRRTLPCEFAERCGGCDFMHIEVDAQRNLKMQIAREQLGRVDSCVAFDETRYRRRARLHFFKNQMGYVRPRTRRVVDVSNCLVLREDIQRGVDVFRNALLPLLEGKGEVELFPGRKAVSFRLVTEAALSPAFYRELTKQIDQGAFDGARLVVQGVVSDLGAPHEVWKSTERNEIVLSPGSFSQANAAVNSAILSKIHATVPGARQGLELYAGSGNFTLALNEKVDTLVSVESNADAVKTLVAEYQSSGVICVQGNAETFPKKDYDWVFLDPPRVGLGRALEAIAECQIPRIYYLGCDIGSLGRDTRKLAAFGYRVCSVDVFDMFPQTHHFETLVVLARK